MKDIPNYEGHYAITEEGQVWSYKSEKFLALFDVRGYYQVNLIKNGIRKRAPIHRLVALTYLPNPNNWPMVDHIDRNTHNNNVKNLRWATAQMNRMNTDLQASSQRSKQYLLEHPEHHQKMIQKASEARSRPVEMRDKQDHSILYKTYPSSYQAAIQEFDDVQKNSRINRCARGKCKSAYGYYWCFVE